MIEKTLTIKNKLGLHARAANKFVDTSCQFASSIEVEYNNKRVDGKGIMSVMLLAAAKGAELTLYIDGSDENEAVDAITFLIDNLFGEGE